MVNHSGCRTKSCFAGSCLAVWLQRQDQRVSSPESNLVYDHRKVACIHHTPGTFSTSLPHRGIEPRPTASKTVMHPPHSQGIYFSVCPDPDSNQDLNLRTVQCNPLHHLDVLFLKRADDWIRTSMIPLTRRTPFSVEPRRQFAAIAASTSVRIRTPCVSFGG